MQCPVCNDTKLTMTERQGIEIDYCPECRGVWLDRGELDKIIERTMPETNGRHEAVKSAHKGSGKRSKQSLLGELFNI